MQIDFTLSFDNKQWVCYNNQIKIVADSLDIIDAKIEDFLNNNYTKQKIEVAMHFDFDRFPIWMRQYMPHYFNRNMIFEIE